MPLVTSLSFGLMAATVLVLFVVPAAYSILDDLGLTAERMPEIAAFQDGDKSRRPWAWLS